MFHIIFDGVKITKSSLRIINLKDEIFMTYSQMEHLCGKRCTFIKYISTPLSFMTEQRKHIITIYNYTNNDYSASFNRISTISNLFQLLQNTLNIIEFDKL